MSVGLLSKYIDDLIACREEDVDAYLQALPAGAQDIGPLLLTARAAYKAIQGIEVDPELLDESRARARQAMAETTDSEVGPEGPSSPPPRR